MTRPLFIVPVADLESGEKRHRWEIPTDWLSATLADTEATPVGEPGVLDVVLGLNGREVVVRGTARARLTMPCSRTLDPVEVNVRADIFLLLSPAPGPGPRRPGKRAEHRRRQAEAADETALSPEEAARDSYDGERVVLDDFVREFIILELPMVPLRSDLRSEETASISAPSGAADRAPEPEAALDPRLAPLAALARRLRDKE
jgi:uncharacterized protein